MKYYKKLLKLKSRQEHYDKQSSSYKAAHKRPGSRNK